MRAPLRLAVLVAVAVASVGCGEPVDLTTGLRVVDVSTGWHDLGVVNGQNKLVPSVTFKVENVSSEPLPVLQMNVLFRRVSEDTEWGSGFVTVARSEGLAPGATSDAFTVHSQLGYTGIESRQTMMANSQFIDARVKLFAKYASTQWVAVGDYPIERRLLAP